MPRWAFWLSQPFWWIRQLWCYFGHQPWMSSPRINRCGPSARFHNRYPCWCTYPDSYLRLCLDFLLDFDIFILTASFSVREPALTFVQPPVLLLLSPFWSGLQIDHINRKQACPLEVYLVLLWWALRRFFFEQMLILVSPLDRGLRYWRPSCHRVIPSLWFSPLVYLSWTGHSLLKSASWSAWRGPRSAGSQAGSCPRRLLWWLLVQLIWPFSFGQRGTGPLRVLALLCEYCLIGLPRDAGSSNVLHMDLVHQLRHGVWSHLGLEDSIAQPSSL